MASFVVERHGFANAGQLATAVITDMLANGFTQVKPTGGTDFNGAAVTFPLRICLEAGPNVDPLNAAAVSEKQPWRIFMDVPTTSATNEVFAMYVAGPLQNTATSPAPERNSSGDITDIIGNVGIALGDTARYTTGNPGVTGLNSVNEDQPTKFLISRYTRVNTVGTSYPLSYRLVITPRGFWLGIWEDALTAELSSSFSWVLVQRPVDRNTGTVLTTGKAPVWCVSSTGGVINQFVVRESDILRPGARRSATANASDSEAIINNLNQVALSEDGKYIVTFPSRLNTSRYRYPHELDMIGITSADVVSQNSDVPLTVYGETAARSYKAMHSTTLGNTGMRLLVLQQGGGVS